jgi:amino acid permease
MSSDAYQMMGMAEMGMLPAFLTHKSRFGTPTYAVLLSGAPPLARDACACHSQR